MSATTPQRSWLALAMVHAQWVLRTTWRNGEQVLLLIGIPLAAFLAITRTELLSTSTPPLAITAVMIVLAAGFTSPAITVAFDRRYGSFAYLGTTPLPRTGILAGTLVAIIASALTAILIVTVIAISLGDATGSSLPLIASAVVLGLVAVVPWAFLLGGTVRSETVLVTANGIFVVATLFGGVLIPASSLPFGALLSWIPTGAMIELTSEPSLPAIAILVLWGVVGTALAVRLFRWR